MFAARFGRLQSGGRRGPAARRQRRDRRSRRNHGGKIVGERRQRLALRARNRFCMRRRGADRLLGHRLDARSTARWRRRLHRHDGSFRLQRPRAIRRGFRQGNGAPQVFSRRRNARRRRLAHRAGAARTILASTTTSVGPPIIIRCSTLSRRTSNRRRRASTVAYSMTASRGCRPRTAPLKRALPNRRTAQAAAPINPSTMRNARKKRTASGISAPNKSNIRPTPPSGCGGCADS